ncbi:MAG: TRAP transporter substrate-binding protein [Anaerotruncus sp.]|nr:TRAP transporter substrate-binding protein [Anaerotruncus sp.]
MIEGIGVGYKIRDKVWEKSKGRLYVDFRPLAQLGGEKDVIGKLKLGAVQGMLCSSVASVNVADRLGLVNLPFVVDSYEKLEKFRANQELFKEYGATALEQGIVVADFTGYGGYGWATKTPVKSLDDARKVNFRIAQAPVNADIYKAWGLKFTVMPWPDVPQALQTGVIDGLDHTIMVCSITKKFDFAPNFTRLDYAQGLYIHLINKKWLDGLPADLQKILLDTITEESATGPPGRAEAARCGDRRGQGERGAVPHPVRRRSQDAGRHDGAGLCNLGGEGRQGIRRQGAQGVG